MMESWRSGREELLEELTRICNKIDSSIVVEIDEENFTSVARDELRFLREQSDRVDELTNEVKRLADELKQYSDAAPRIEAHIEENKRLSAALGKATEQNQMQAAPNADKRNDEPTVSKPTLHLDELPSSSKRTHKTESLSKKYNDLVEKYNPLCKTYLELKDVVWVVEKEKRRRLSAQLKAHEETILLNDKKIQSLEEQIRRLASNDIPNISTSDVQQLQDVVSAFTNQSAASRSLSPVSRNLNPLLAAHTTVMVPASPKEARILLEDHFDHGATSDTTAIIGVTKNSLENPTAERSQAFEPQSCLDNLLELLQPSIPRYASVESPTTEPRKSVECHEPPRLHCEGLSSVDDTQFERLEPFEQSEPMEHFHHHSSSTEDDIDAASQKITTLEFDTNKRITAKIPDSPNSLVIVSTRNVRKRKVPHEPIEKSPAVKIELTSSPVGIVAIKNSGHEDSFDLDEIGEKVCTPKKRRLLLHLPRKDSGLSSVSQASYGSTELDLHNLPRTRESSNATSSRSGSVKSNRPASPLRSLDHNQLVLPRMSTLRRPEKWRLSSDKAVRDLAEDGQTVPTTEDTPYRKNNEIDSRLGGLLAKPSPPKQVLSPARPARSDTPRDILLHARLKLPTKSSLTRDEENSRTPQSKPRSTLKKTTRRPLSPSRTITKAFRGSFIEPPKLASEGTSKGLPDPVSGGGCGRLGNYAKYLPDVTPDHRRAENITPRKPIETPTPLSRPAIAQSEVTKRTKRTSIELPTPPTRPLSRYSAGISKSRRKLLRENEKGPPWDVYPDSEPLRCRPVSTLQLEDFKINPEANGGYDYAFVDVVRKKADRKCLPGCTRQECCGKPFKMLASMMLDNAPKTKAQEEANEVLLEEFLGDNAHKLRNMAREEKEKVLLQAKTREIANQYGRHRHAFERKRSPPGFWEADFPTTQEHMAEREETRQREQEEVVKRYEEAMRPGGRFIFRDE